VLSKKELRAWAFSYAADVLTASAGGDDLLIEEPSESEEQDAARREMLLKLARRLRAKSERT